jgi:plastocyanin
MTHVASTAPARLPARSPRLRRLTAAIAVLVLAVVGLSIGLSAAPATATDATVKIDNFTFGPKVLTVKAGTTVTWVNQDDIPHTIVDKSRKVFRSKPLDTDDQYSFTFTQPGTYDYFCGLHPHMTAQVVVTP